MMNEAELRAYFEKHQVSEDAQEIIKETRNNPAQLIGTNAKNNLCTWFSSQKMQQTIQAESRTAEYAFCLEREHEPDTLEFWDQVSSTVIERTYRNGSKHNDWYTADFLVLHKNGPIAYEVKPEKQLEKLCADNLVDWQLKDGEYIYKPALKAFSEIGLSYQVFSTARLDPIRTANLRILLQSRLVDCQITYEVRQKVSRILSERAWLSLSELVKFIEIEDLTVIIQLIDEGFLYSCIEEDLLSQSKSTVITKSKELFDYYRECKNNDFDSYIASSPNCSSNLTFVPSEKQAIRVLEILKRIECGEKSRSVYRWNKKIQKGKKKGLSPFQALLPKYHCRGNRKQRVHVKCTRFLNEFIHDEYASSNRMLMHTAYRKYKVLAKRKHPKYPPLSWPSFRNYLRKANQSDIAKGRGGTRAANAQDEPVSVGDRELRATLPFELATLDHYKADIFCVIIDVNGKRYTARPWVSALIDVCTGAVLAIWVSFREPSVRACAMVIRRCVRRHKRLPQGIIVDRGPEFRSVYFHALLAHCKVDLVLRPKAHPRYGSEVERFFETFKTLWLNLRPGNMAQHKESRSVSSTHSPEKNAELTIEQFLLEAFRFIEWKNSNISDRLFSSPEDLQNKGVKQYPFIGSKIVIDDNFIIATAVDGRNYKVDPVRGIHAGNGFHFSDPSLAKLKEHRRPVQVRIEPEDPYRLYVLVGDDWITYLATPENVFNTKDPVLRLAEAIRVHDGREALKRAKEDADESLIALLSEMEKTASLITAKPDVKSLTGSKGSESVTPDWEQYITLEPLAVSEWEDEQ